MKRLIDKKLLIILLGYVGAYHIIFISKGVFLKLKEIEVYNTLSWKNIVIDPIIQNLIIMTPTIILIINVTKRIIKKKISWKALVILNFLFSLLYIIIIYLFLYIFQIITNKRSFNTLSIEDFVLDTIMNANLHFLGYVGFVTIIYCYYYINENFTIKLQKTQLSRQLTESKLELLKVKLNPHFLFNTLHSISSLIEKSPKKAQNMITDLGGLLRELIDGKSNNLIPLQLELSTLKKYIDIMLIRFSDHLTININYNENIVDVFVPSFIIQPLIENSIKHGYSIKNTKLSIQVRIYKKENNLIIEVENDGKPLETKSNLSYGTGLINIRERLETLYKNNFKMRITSSKKEKGVLNTIVIPFSDNDHNALLQII